MHGCVSKLRFHDTVTTLIHALFVSQSPSAVSDDRVRSSLSMTTAERARSVKPTASSVVHRYVPGAHPAVLLSGGRHLGVDMSRRLRTLLVQNGFKDVTDEGNGRCCTLERSRTTRLPAPHTGTHRTGHSSLLMVSLRSV